jgi:prophage DNA circulation protein
MATRKRTTPPEPAWQVILEDIRSQNRATIEAVEASRVEMNARFDQGQEQTVARFTVVEAAIRNVTNDVRELKTDVKILKTDVAGLQTDLRRVEGKVDGLSSLEARVTALERSR